MRYYLEDRGNPREGPLFLSHKGEQLDPRFISEAIKKIAVKAFGPEKTQKFEVRHLRDAYKNALQRAKLSAETVDKLFGHKRAGAKEAYQLEQALIEEAYAQAFQYMTINSITQGTQDLREIQKRQEEMDLKINQEREERSQDMAMLTKIIREQAQQIQQQRRALRMLLLQSSLSGGELEALSFRDPQDVDRYLEKAGFTKEDIQKAWDEATIRHLIYKAVQKSKGS
ncbi:MAG: hypothetical protein OEZ48_06990 [Candidatus Bathyarchaeota archaeon]|nr:hypothetical protein [Candidatus Bathyarchaeota archaeon]